MRATCLVAAKDFRQHWQKEIAIVPPPPSWDGLERRLGPVDRRIHQHDRRWDASLGRRRRLSDRRKGTR
jgi:hypothetical protein